MGQLEKHLHELAEMIAKKFSNHKDIVQKSGNKSLKPKTPTQFHTLMVETIQNWTETKNNGFI